METLTMEMDVMEGAKGKGKKFVVMDMSKQEKHVMMGTYMITTGAALTVRSKMIGLALVPHQTAIEVDPHVGMEFMTLGKNVTTRIPGMEMAVQTAKSMTPGFVMAIPQTAIQLCSVATRKFRQGKVATMEEEFQEMVAMIGAESKRDGIVSMNLQFVRGYRFVGIAKRKVLKNATMEIQAHLTDVVQIAKSKLGGLAITI